MDVPVTRYAKSGEFDIAYQVLGDGPPDLVFVPGWITHLDLQWEEPSLARFLTRLASFSRLIVFDKRGIGLSDRVSADRMPTMEERMIDVRAVLALVRVPTVVIARDEAFLPKGAVDVPPQEEARWVASRIPDAKYVVVPGKDYLPWVGDQESLLAEIEQFVTGRRRSQE